VCLGTTAQKDKEEGTTEQKNGGDTAQSPKPSRLCFVCILVILAQVTYQIEQ